MISGQRDAGESRAQLGEGVVNDRHRASGITWHGPDGSAGHRHWPGDTARVITPWADTHFAGGPSFVLRRSFARKPQGPRVRRLFAARQGEAAFARVPTAEVLTVLGAKHLWVGEPYVRIALSEIVRRVNPAALVPSTMTLPTDWEEP